jgi:hypothetical protein
MGRPAPLEPREPIRNTSEHVIEGLGLIVYKVESMREFPVLIAALFAMLLLGCATTKIDWNSRIGTYTYDEAVTELGVPDRQATLTDGSIVAEWLTARGGAWGHSHSFGRYSRIHTYDIQQMPDRYLRLVFGPDRLLARAGKFAR